ncbi:uncharacterized protein ATNIH1004_007910 [Aspergillus tanneri]|uniref:Uncharacterized protein n=1 Tax=Aspergillus tanneri TaxID=1220188 RepID=A0A5M9MVH3_9EURO|nr:uncharacterized protein ATNIH1004_007910 [Aspergillus tanneri]KAA8646477.1 hypothetical protein ATNIH1004_007910 [Aspergillus tanneri]
MLPGPAAAEIPIVAAAEGDQKSGLRTVLIINRDKCAYCRCRGQHKEQCELNHGYRAIGCMEIEARDTRVVLAVTVVVPRGGGPSPPQLGERASRHR